MGSIGVHEEGNARQKHHFLTAHPFGGEIGGEVRNTSRTCFRPRDIAHDSQRDGVGDGSRNDRNL